MNGRKGNSKVKKYVEGESDDEDEEGEIEDVVLGPAGGEFGDEDSEFDEEEDDLDSAFEDEEDGNGTSKPRRKVRNDSS